MTEDRGVFDNVELDEDAKIKVDIKIENTINAMTPMVYIDNFTLRTNWVD
ncbi:hypothetical protein VIBRN418_16133 [Vibrio sp. N418]|nr:hypothetical protein VIBRN418_16133 [Vibrio sp. N418]